MQWRTIFNGMTARPHVLLLSGETPDELERRTSEVAAELERRREGGLDELAARLSRLDHPRAHRRVVVAADAAAAAEVLRSGDPQAVRTAPRPADGGAVAFAFPGGGAQHPGMVGRLYALSPVVRTEVDRCAELLDVDVRRALDPATSPSELEQPVLGLCALFVAEHALARLWLSLAGLFAGSASVLRVLLRRRRLPEEDLDADPLPAPVQERAVSSRGYLR